MAVEVPFDNLMDVVVVNDDLIAVKCTSYLKGRPAGVATFIPRADVRPWPVSERLRRIGCTARLVSDVATHE